MLVAGNIGEGGAVLVFYLFTDLNLRPMEGGGLGFLLIRGLKVMLLLFLPCLGLPCPHLKLAASKRKSKKSYCP